MKNLLITTVLALAGMFNAFAMDDGHVLSKLWSQYEEAHKADRPQKEAEILSQIKAEALSRHLPVDFYDAATRYVNAVERRDWKQRDAVRNGLAEEVERFNDPLVTFLWMRDWQNASTDRLWKYVNENLAGFSGNHPALHRGVDSFFSGALKPFIRSDKEFVLWNLLQGRRYSRAQDDEIYQALKAELDGSYPGDGILEYYILNRKYYTRSEYPKKRAALQALVNQYAGKALALFPEADLLQMDKDDLDYNKARSAQYQALDAACQRFETRRKAFKGSESILAEACDDVENLKNVLEGKDLDVEASPTQVKVIFRNLTHANLTLRQGKTTVKTWKLANQAASFYVQDTVKVDLPKLSDGDYTVEAVTGKYSAQAGFVQYTLSIATRTDSSGPCVYVADYETGEPLSKARIRLLKGDKELAVSTLQLNGFTPLPAAMVKAMKDKDGYYRLEASSGTRKSRTLGFGRDVRYVTYSDQTRCHIYKDQGAYRPGDTLRFKAVVFRGDPALKLLVQKGREVEVRLHDSEDNVIESQKLTTNEFGAVSGRFVLPTGLRNGRFELEVVGLGYDWFRVDEFVLPSFDLEFDQVEQLYLVGSDVPLGGKVVSYSGHKLQGAQVRYMVSHYGTVVAEGAGAIDADNRFLFAFPARTSGYYQADVTVVDATGETRSFNRSWYISDAIGVDASVTGAADASLSLKDQEEPLRSWLNYGTRFTVESTALKLQLLSRDNAGNTVPVPVSYVIEKQGGAPLTSGEVASGTTLDYTLPGSGLYRVTASVKAVRPDGQEVTGSKTILILCLQPKDQTLDGSVSRLIVSGPASVAPGAVVQARLGTGEGTAYAWATLYGQDSQLLSVKKVQVADGKVADISFPYLDSYPDAVRLNIFYFIHGQAVSFDRQFRRAKDRYSVPLSFTRFQDKAYPGTEYTFRLKTAANVEVLAAAWDKSLDAMGVNDWPTVTLRDFSVPQVPVNSACGRVGSGGYSDGPVVAYGVRTKGAARNREPMVLESAVMMDERADFAAAEEEAVPFQLVEEKPGFGALGEVRVRTDFASALTFQPHLRPEADGSLSFRFRTSDKLSTYYVRVYAHDENMHNALCEQEMVVSLPVKVSLLEPRFLYGGDVYQAAVTVSSNTEEAVSGLLVLRAGDVSHQLPVTVKPGETLSKRFKLEIPEQAGNDGTASSPAAGELTLTASFVASDFSDAVQVTVPVYPAAQTLTEAHSAVLRDGMDREALLSQLRSRFVNVPASAAALREISVLDMVKDAIPAHVEPAANDVLSLSEAYYVRLMASRLSYQSERSEESVSDSALMEKILSCRNSDGGFAWFEDMPSNAIITAVVLERFALLRERGFEVPDLTETVKFLDKNQFGTVFPLWRGWVSDAQYMRVRAMYPEVPFKVNAVSVADRKRLSEFKKYAKDYLTPSKKDGRGLQGQILAKARRLLTLRCLNASSEGKALASAWGIGLSSKLAKSIDADVLSLLEYAVEHRDGGWYYPNAVMPYRGLLESEAYAHALLCQLLSAEGETPSSASLRDPVRANASEGVSPSAIADGIRLWLMLQKETQKWDTEPAFVDAITAILDGSEAVLNTRVVVLSATYEAPFQKIKATGNGFTLSREFYKAVTEERLYDDKSGPNDLVSKWVAIKPGETVKVGDRIRVVYSIWNAENRSFVKVTAGREASLSPVEQKSGSLGWGFIRPYRSGVTWSYTPYGYRNVKASATEYYFDTYPEEKTTLSEEFFVTQAGSFVAPVTVIESLYAPHYRANSAFRGVLGSVAE